MEINNSNSIYVKYVKRFLDLVFSIILFILFLPLGIVIFLLIKSEDIYSPAIFKQIRSGKNNIPFYIYKFRSMRESAPSNIATSDFHNSHMYVTKVGKFIRSTSLDELPQLINIMKGEMSFIGPRPVIINEIELINQRIKLNAIKVLPGVTGLAQINGRDNITIEEKAYYDKVYCENVSLLFDIKILLKTIPVVFMKLGNNDSRK